MTQSRRGSFIEAVANIMIGLLVALLTQLVIFPRFGWSPPLETNLKISAVFTGMSLVRSYCVRRLFNRIRSGVFA